MSGIFAKITVFFVIFIDFLDGFCYNSNIARYCVEAQVLSEKNVAGRPLKYSAESMAGCDTTIPALGSALSFFSGLPVFFVFPGSAQADASLSYVITSRGGF